MPSFVSNQKYLCDQCLQPFKRRDHLARHLREAPANHLFRFYKCDYCSQPFKNKENLPTHFQEKHGWNANCDLRFECQLCGAVYRQSNYFQHHLTSVHGNLTFDCDTCGKPFASRTLLYKHIIGVHEQLKLFECHLCDTKFTLSSNLKSHIDHMHKHSKPLAICDVCGKSSLKHNLAGHVQTHMENKKQRLNCGHCNASYSNLGPLRFHMALKHPESQSSHKLIECDDCELKCRAQNALLRHINTVHLKLRPFHCSQCDANFSGIGNLRKHTEAVHKNMVLVCDLCSKTYSSRSKQGLAWHYWTEHARQEPKQFKCNQCEVTFSENTKLKEHKERAHKTILVCDGCLFDGSIKRFKGRDALARHILVEHMELRPVKCNECQADFCSYPALRRHKREVHN